MIGGYQLDLFRAGPPPEEVARFEALTGAWRHFCPDCGYHAIDENDVEFEECCTCHSEKRCWRDD